MPSSNDHRIRRGPQQSHDEAIRLIEPADIAAAGFSGNLETDHAVECAYEVADYIGLDRHAPGIADLRRKESSVPPAEPHVRAIPLSSSVLIGLLFGPIVLNVFLKRNSVVVLGVVRAVQKSHRILTRGLTDRLPASGRAIELGKISTTEFLPFLGVVTEPLSQFGAWRGILEPAIEVQIGLS